MLVTGRGGSIGWVTASAGGFADIMSGCTGAAASTFGLGLSSSVSALAVGSGSTGGSGNGSGALVGGGARGGTQCVRSPYQATPAIKAMENRAPTMKFRRRRSGGSWLLWILVVGNTTASKTSSE